MSFNNFIKYFFVAPVIGYCMICTGYATQHTYTITNTNLAYNYSDNQLRTFGFRSTDNDSGHGNWLEVADNKYLNCGHETKDWLVLAPAGAKVRYKVKDIAGHDVFLNAVGRFVGKDAEWKKGPDELTDDDKSEYVWGAGTAGVGALTVYLGVKLGPKVLVAGGGGLGVLAGIGLIGYGILDEVEQNEHALTIESNGSLVLKCSDDLWVPYSTINTESCGTDKKVHNTFDTSGDFDDIHVFDTDITLYYKGESEAPFKQICACDKCQKPDGSCVECNPQCQHYNANDAPDYQVHTGWVLTKKCSEHENHKKSATQLVLSGPQKTALVNHLNVNGEAKCDYKCTAAGWEITPNRSHYCDPTQQPAKAADGSYTFSCVDTEETVAQKQADALEATNACATAICGASGGLYDTVNQKCKCGNYVCTTEFLVNGTPYKYCSGVEGDLGTYFCVNNVLDLGLPETHDCHKKNRSQDLPSAEACYLWKVQTAYNDTQACATAASSAAATDNSANNDATPDTISDLAKTLDAIENAYGLSKWRTVDGKFNYARLASDATAAVVLGTTGALVTSSVVKKKQVEAGFESLECTVGGQHVGDWGDVFRIDGK